MLVSLFPSPQPHFRQIRVRRMRVLMNRQSRVTDDQSFPKYLYEQAFSHYGAAKSAQIECGTVQHQARLCQLLRAAMASDPIGQYVPARTWRTAPGGPVSSPQRFVKSSPTFSTSACSGQCLFDAQSQQYSPNSKDCIRSATPTSVSSHGQMTSPPTGWRSTTRRFRQSQAVEAISNTFPHRRFRKA